MAYHKFSVPSLLRILIESHFDKSVSVSRISISECKNYFVVAFSNVSAILYRFRGLYATFDAPYFVESGRFGETRILKKYDSSGMHPIRDLLIIDDGRIVLRLLMVIFTHGIV